VSSSLDVDQFYETVIEKYNRHINPSLARLMSFAGFGAEIRAEGCYIYDHEDRKFLDMLGGYGVFTLGHRHPKVVEAVKTQLDKMPLSGRAFFSPVAADLAEKISEITPGNLDFVFFCNSGTEAVEAGLKLAKGASGRSKIVSTHNAFHGKTLGALSTIGKEKYRKPFAPLIPGVSFVEFGNLEEAIREIDSTTACMIIEPIQGEGGINIPPDGYLTGLKAACAKHGAFLIADEVQTGLGRTGKMFGGDHDGAAPDLMPLAKAIGGGVMPLGCLVGTSEIWEATFGKNPLIHSSTFGGNPLACAAGIAALEVIADDGLVEKSRILGERLLLGMKQIHKNHSDLICDVRGRGLMVGVEFSLDEVSELVVPQLLKRGVCVAYALNNPRVLRFEPPLIISEKQIDFALEAFESSVSETSELLATLV